MGCRPPACRPGRKAHPRGGQTWLEPRTPANRRGAGARLRGARERNMERAAPSARRSRPAPRKRGVDPQGELDRLLQKGAEADADAFWDQVERNLDANRLRLLFISDRIPDELARVVTFLNEQMPNIEVLAVEIKRFLGRDEPDPRAACHRKVHSDRPRGATTGRYTRYARVVPRRHSPTNASGTWRLPCLTSRARAGASHRVRSNQVPPFASGAIPYRQPITVAWLYPRQGHSN